MRPSCGRSHVTSMPWRSSSSYRETSQRSAASLEAITVATRNAALLIGASDWGTIEAGKLATLIVVDGRPDRNISDTRRVVEVMLRGRKIDRESLKMAHQNDPGYEPVSPTDL